MTWLGWSQLAIIIIIIIIIITITITIIIIIITTSRDRVDSAYSCQQLGTSIVSETLGRLPR